MYEFLYRGQSDGSGAWHVILGAQVDDGFGGKITVYQGPLSVAQAEKLGHSLDSVIGEIASGLTRQIEALSDKLEGAQQEIKTANDAVAAAREQISALSAIVVPGASA